jgi:2-oxoglutarate-Fe(II)-dependent oxygenase superfamily protein
MAADLLAMLRKRLESARFSRRIEDGVEIELTLEEPAPLALAMVALNDPALFATIDRITACGPVGCFSGRVYSRQARADGAHYYPWHNDLGHERLVGLSVNLSDASFEGGVLEVREQPSKRIVARVANRTAGDAILFRISADLEHHVTPVTAGGARLVLAGWFRRSPDFWRHACASS